MLFEEMESSEGTFVAVEAEEIVDEPFVDWDKATLAEAMGVPMQGTVEVPFTPQGWAEEKLEQAKRISRMSDRAYRALFGF